jgi:DNA-directed RNA polymerase specialized sigma24 family protein
LKPELKKGWVPTRSALQHVLSWLDEGVDSGGEVYLEMRRRLVSYFERKRCLTPDELADETLNRVARRLEEEGAITDAPARYCYIVARYVFLEYLRRPEHNQASLSGDRGSRYQAPELSSPFDLQDGMEARERLLDCLDRCLGQLEADDRRLILEYYRGEQRVKIEHRRELAVRLGVTANALSIRACRIRDKLEACVTACSGGN